MKKHCKSLWQDVTGIHSVELNKLSPMNYHFDNRWYWRDLPRIIDDGLWYPLLYFKLTLDFWNNNFRSRKGGTRVWDKINPPTVNEDNMIWGVYQGTNRLKCLSFMGYDSVDCLVFKGQKELIEYALYIRDKDPLHGKL